MSKELEKWVRFDPAYDKRDPNPNKNYGIHGVNMIMYLRGSEGVVQFLVFTNWHLPHVTEELKTKLQHTFEPTPADLGYHSPVPMYEDQSQLECDLLPGRKCYYDGSGLNAERIFNVLLTEGSDGVWRELEIYYNQTFGQGATEVWQI